MSYYGYAGIDNIVGAPLETIVGADDLTARPASAQAMTVRPEQRFGGPRLVPQRLDEARELLLGFGPTSLLNGSTNVFTTQPQLPFRPSRFVIPSAAVANFSINDLKIGKNSQFLSSNSVPAAVFSELAVGVALGLDTCNVGQQITVSVTNTAAAPATFSAALIGTSLQ